ncbi:TraI domain-containing protein [Undibacterium arcticum]
MDLYPRFLLSHIRSRHLSRFYPPVDVGIAVTDADQILASQQAMMDRLRILAGGTVEHYQRYYEVIVKKNLATYIQLLPASQTETHQGAGGLFRLCLEVGFFSPCSRQNVSSSPVKFKWSCGENWNQDGDMPPFWPLCVANFIALCQTWWLPARKERLGQNT